MYSRSMGGGTTTGYPPHDFQWGGQVPPVPPGFTPMKISKKINITHFLNRNDRRQALHSTAFVRYIFQQPDW